MPFAVSGPASAQYLGPSMVDLLHMALDGVGRIRIENAPTTLRRLARLRDPRDVEMASGVALEVGAGRVIVGTVVALGSDVRIRAQVFDAIRSRPQFVVEGRATTDNVTAAVDSLATQILARRIVPPAERSRLTLGEYATKSPKALQAYLVGRQHVRQGQRRSAADSILSALRHDPDFGLAHLLRARLEGNFVTGVGLNAVLSDARARQGRFPERVRAMFADHRDDRVRTLAYVKDLARHYPTDPDVAFWLADTYFHHGLNLGEQLDVVVASFQRALSYDDQDPELLAHLSLLLAESGDSTGSREAFERCRAISSILVCGDDLAFRAIFRREDPRLIASGADSLYGASLVHPVLRIAAWDPAFGLAITDSFARIQTAPSRSPEHRARAYIIRSNVALAHGQYEAAWRFLDTAATLGVPQVAGYQILHDIVSGGKKDEAARVIARDYDPVELVTRAWWAAVRLPADSAEPFLRSLETTAFPDYPVEPDSATRLTIAQGLRGLVALRRGDTARAHELLTRVRATNSRSPIPRRVILPEAALSLVLAQLEAVHGSNAKAELYLADVYPLNHYVPFIGDAEELRARVALARADTVAAKTHLRNVIAVWGRADPPLQPRVAAARATLARLGRHQP